MQSSIEGLIGRLMADEGFRSSFLMNCACAVQSLIETGYQVTAFVTTAAHAIAQPRPGKRSVVTESRLFRPRFEDGVTMKGHVASTLLLLCLIGITCSRSSVRIGSPMASWSNTLRAISE